jgi:hypothetical protein
VTQRDTRDRDRIRPGNERAPQRYIRQVVSLLERAGVAPDRPPVADDLRGLPLTDKVWDEN